MTNKELRAITRAHPYEATVDAEGVELQRSPWCPGCDNEQRPCTIARLIRRFVPFLHQPENEPCYGGAGYCDCRKCRR